MKYKQAVENSIKLLFPAVVMIAINIACSEAPVESTTKVVVQHRDNCLVCHKPLNEKGLPHGIETSHPWEELNCQDCHGGNPRVCDGTISQTSEPQCDTGWIYDKDRAHVSPGDGPAYIKNLTSPLLDKIDLDYIRFINPGDLRVADKACGGECHPEAVKNVSLSRMSHTSGEIAVARYRADGEDHKFEPFGSVDLVEGGDNSGEFDDSGDTIANMAKFDPPAIKVSTVNLRAKTDAIISEIQDQYLAKACLGCHVNDFGANAFPGNFRSSGCSSCHMSYADDGLSQSSDPTVNKETTPHPTTHTMTTTPSVTECSHCHYRGARIGMNFQGIRESAGQNLNPANATTLDKALHGHDADYYLVDEDDTNDIDETPPDVHFDAGMHCIDCHTKTELHGDGKLPRNYKGSVTTTCEDCHGTARDRAQEHDHRPEFKERDGEFYLTTKISKKELLVPQVLDSVTPGNPHFSDLAQKTMGVNDRGDSHTDKVECYTCHSGWMPNCYGCHVSVDFSKSKAYLATGEKHPGRVAGTRAWITTNDMVLMINGNNKIAPSMPSEKLFFTVKVPDQTTEIKRSATVIKNKPRIFTFSDGRKIAGFGQRTVNPHSTVRNSSFSACDRCHSTNNVTDPGNKVLLDITHGFGSKRFPFVGCNVENDIETCDEDDQKTYYLDALQTTEGLPLVVGTPGEGGSRPLNTQEVNRMRGIIVPQTIDIPEDAETNPAWP